MKKIYQTKGTCASQIEIETQGNTIKSVNFVGGCGGNAKGLATLIEGMNIDDVIGRLDGVTCGLRGTSCPDQLARALKEMKDGKKGVQILPKQ